MAKIDWRVFWGMAAGAELPIGDMLALLALPDQPPAWRKKQQNLLDAIAECAASKYCATTSRKRLSCWAAGAPEGLP